MRVSRWLGRGGLLMLVAWSGAACNELLGIEEAAVDPRFDDDGDAGHSPVVGGSAGTGGISASSGTGGGSGDSSLSGGSAGASPVPAAEPVETPNRTLSLRQTSEIGTRVPSSATAHSRRWS